MRYATGIRSNRQQDPTEVPLSEMFGHATQHLFRRVHSMEYPWKYDDNEQQHAQGQLKPGKINVQGLLKPLKMCCFPKEST